MTLYSRGLVAAVAVVVLVGCTSSDEPSRATSVPGASSSPAVTSAMFEAAYRALPMDGTEDMPIIWETSEVSDSAVVLAARRNLVHYYWSRNVTDWTSIFPLARFLVTDRVYEGVYEPDLDVTDSGGGSSGPIWVKMVGVEEIDPNQVRVFFCTDVGYFLDPEDETPEVREDRARLQSFRMVYEQAGDGERRWISDGVSWHTRDPEYAKDVAECTAWATHKP